ncbi:RNA recognition motif domain containing protein [Acanthamoeba castellanii str. Neff]|uniref:RNA recognition motif domain containing protein n=1 Tax=Acanthamoeba castellanii (strain ATCC 30010 / Neff) TaxID=1257118 RepID=L8H3A3_ACACF|nr:RNA recognition motif domain containing protein [Acanthamoeba castellanii str. Neff]ELR19193.1 RNA recognition motif domain containing protein [Acanthamoeba castellanii str. Neff]
MLLGGGAGLPSWDGETRVYVGRLPDNVDRNELESIFAQYGPIKKWSFGSRNFAFVEYFSHNAAALAVQHGGNVFLRSQKYHQRLGLPPLASMMALPVGSLSSNVQLPPIRNPPQAPIYGRSPGLESFPSPQLLTTSGDADPYLRGDRFAAQPPHSSDPGRGRDMEWERYAGGAAARSSRDRPAAEHYREAEPPAAPGSVSLHRSGSPTVVGQTSTPIFMASARREGDDALLRTSMSTSSPPPPASPPAYEKEREKRHSFLSSPIVESESSAAPSSSSSSTYHSSPSSIDSNADRYSSLSGLSSSSHTLAPYSPMPTSPPLPGGVQSPPLHHHGSVPQSSQVGAPWTSDSEAEGLKEGEEYLLTTLYIKNLAYQITDEDLKIKLESHECKEGLKAIRWITDKMQGHFTGEAFVEYESAELAARALDKLKGRRMLGRRMKISYAKSKKKTPMPALTGEREVKEEKRPKYPGCKTIFIAKLDDGMTDATLKEIFGVFGEIQRVHRLFDANTKKFKGCAFICYSAPEEADSAVRQMDGVRLFGKGRFIDVNFADKPDPVHPTTPVPSAGQSPYLSPAGLGLGLGTIPLSPPFSPSLQGVQLSPRSSSGSFTYPPLSPPPSTASPSLMPGVPLSPAVSSPSLPSPSPFIAAQAAHHTPSAEAETDRTPRPTDRSTVAAVTSTIITATTPGTQTVPTTTPAAQEQPQPNVNVAVSSTAERQPTPASPPAPAAPAQQPTAASTTALAAANAEDKSTPTGKWGAMPLKYRILKSFGMPTKDDRSRDSTNAQLPSPAPATTNGQLDGPASASAVALRREQQRRRMEEELKNDKIEAGLAQARERERERRERMEDEELLRRPRGAAALVKRKRSEDYGAGPSGAVGLRARPKGKRPKRESEYDDYEDENDDDDDENDERDGDHIEGPTSATAATRQQLHQQHPKKKPQRRAVVVDDEDDEDQEPENEEEIKTRMEVIINKYDAMKDKNTAVAFLLNVIRNSNRTKIEVGTAWRHPAEYADIYGELGMIKLPVVNGRYHMWQLPREGSVRRVYLDSLKPAETKEKKKRGKKRKEEKMREEEEERRRRSEEAAAARAAAANKRALDKKASAAAAEAVVVAAASHHQAPPKKMKREAPPVVGSKELPGVERRRSKEQPLFKSKAVDAAAATATTLKKEELCSAPAAKKASPAAATTVVVATKPPKKQPLPQTTRPEEKTEAEAQPQPQPTQRRGEEEGKVPTDDAVMLTSEELTGHLHHQTEAAVGQSSSSCGIESEAMEVEVKEEMGGEAKEAETAPEASRGSEPEPELEETKSKPGDEQVKEKEEETKGDDGGASKQKLIEGEPTSTTEKRENETPTPATEEAKEERTTQATEQQREEEEEKEKAKNEDENENAKETSALMSEEAAAVEKEEPKVETSVSTQRLEEEKGEEEETTATSVKPDEAKEAKPATSASTTGDAQAEEEDAVVQSEVKEEQKEEKKKKKRKATSESEEKKQSKPEKKKAKTKTAKREKKEEEKEDEETKETKKVKAVESEDEEEKSDPPQPTRRRRGRAAASASSPAGGAGRRRVVDDGPPEELLRVLQREALGLRKRTGGGASSSRVEKASFLEEMRERRKERNRERLKREREEELQREKERRRKRAERERERRREKKEKEEREKEKEKEKERAKEGTAGKKEEKEGGGDKERKRRER